MIEEEIVTLLMKIPSVILTLVPEVATTKMFSTSCVLFLLFLTSLTATEAGTEPSTIATDTESTSEDFSADPTDTTVTTESSSDHYDTTILFEETTAYTGVNEEANSTGIESTLLASSSTQSTREETTSPARSSKQSIRDATSEYMDRLENSTETESTNSLNDQSPTSPVFETTTPTTTTTTTISTTSGVKIESRSKNSADTAAETRFTNDEVATASARKNQSSTRTVGIVLASIFISLAAFYIILSVMKRYRAASYTVRNANMELGEA